MLDNIQAEILKGSKSFVPTFNIAEKAIENHNNTDDFAKDLIDSLNEPLEICEKRIEVSTKKTSEEITKVEDICITELIKQNLSNSFLLRVAEEGKKLKNSTLRAVALKYKEKERVKGDITEIEDVIFKALDIISSECTYAIENELYVTLEKTKKEHRNVNRYDIERSYKEYIEMLVIHKSMKDKAVILKDDKIFTLKILKEEYLSNSGFLYTPIYFYNETINHAINYLDVGKDKREVNIYSKFLDNLSIANIFKEDIFKIY